MANRPCRTVRGLMRPRLLAAALLIGFASLTWWWTVDDIHAWRQHSALDKSGVTTAATVLRYSYDPNGGDPGGWTTDQIRFATNRGATVVATVGHHDPGPERTNRVLDVTYDPQHLTVVRAAHYLDDADDPSTIVADAIFATVMTTAAVLTVHVAKRKPGSADRTGGGSCGRVPW